MLNTVFLVIWNMISQSAVVFCWKFLADDFWLCIFASQHSRSRYLPGQPAQALFLSAPTHFSSWPPHCSVLAAFPRGGTAGLGCRCSSCCATVPPEQGPRRADTGAGHMLVARVAGAGHACAGDIPWPGSGWRWCGRSSSRTRGYTTIEKLESSFCLSLVHFTDMKIEKGEIYEENLISHSCWMDLVWYWPDFTMCLLKALEYILYVKDCNNFKKKK